MTFREKREKVVAAREEVLEASLLRSFLPTERGHSDDLEFFTLASVLPSSPEDLTHTAPASISVYEGAFSRGGLGLEQDSFAQGAAMVAGFLESGEADRAAELLNMALEQMTERQMFPALSEKYVEDYSTIGTVVLLSEEFPNWYPILAYNLGAWWFLGHVAGVDGVKVGPPGRGRKLLKRLLFDTMLDRAKKGVLEPY